MITEYHRPKSLEEALRLLSRPDPPTLPIGGGTALAGWQAVGAAPAASLAVVDLQELGLAHIQTRGQALEIGAAATLQAVLEHPALPAGLAQAVELEAAYNLRQSATLGGLLVSAGGRSPLLTALLALDAALTLAPGESSLPLGELISGRGASARLAALNHGLILRVTIPRNARLAYASAARSPADQPLVCCAAARWPSGRIRLALGGFGKAPTLALDGPEPGGVEHAVRSACAHAGDEWASAEYRGEAAAALARRCLEQVGA